MKAFHNAFAAALLCGAVSFVLPSQAATTATGSSSQTTTSTSNEASGTVEKKATETKRAVRHIASIRSEISPKENAETADLNRQSAQAAQAGTTPTFTESTPASQQVVQSGEPAKKIVKTRVRRTRVNNVNKKPPTG